MGDKNSAIAVLMVGFGGPERFEDVRPFIENVVRGRNVPQERIETVVEQYREIGGRSPYNELTKRQAAALQAQLAKLGIEVKVDLGMLFSGPRIAEAIEEMCKQSVKNLVVLIMAPHRTEASYDRYKSAVGQSVQMVADDSAFTTPVVTFTNAWHDHPLFVDSVADLVRTELGKLPPKAHDQTRIIFSAHSVPQEMSDKSGYAKQVEESANAVFARIAPSLSPAGARADKRPEPARPGSADASMDYAVGFQSRSGSPTQKWLEPDLAECMSQAKAQGKTHVVLAPIGFLVDHVEVLYDLDVLAAGHARQLGLTMLRVPTVGVQPKFIELLAIRVKEQLESLNVDS